MKELNTAAQLAPFVACCQFASEEGQKRTFDLIQAELKPDKILTHKTIGGQELTVQFFLPYGFRSSDSRPAFVAIHGGGWVGGTPQRFYPYANALLEKGCVGVSVEYRLVDGKKGTTVFNSVKDGRSAMRYIRANSKELGAQVIPGNT